MTILYDNLVTEQRSGYYRNSQTGATLIVVLFVVLLLAILSIMVIKTGRTTLDMTTASQVHKLLVESSDVPLAKLENANIDTDSNNKVILTGMASQDGPVGYLMQEGNQDKEYILCYRPTTNKGLYQPGGHLILIPNGDSDIARQGSSTGYCDLTTDSAYTSSRKTVSSQVTMTRPTINKGTKDDVQIQPLMANNIGIDGASVSVKNSAYFRSYVTSVLPALSLNSSLSDINTCLQLPIGGDSGTTSSTSQVACLNAQNTPNNIQVQDYAYNLVPK